MDKSSKETLTKQIYRLIKEGILRGDFLDHQKLPSTRALSKDLEVSRIVVVDAYEQLLAEGYVYSVEGAGTYVSAGIQLPIEATLTSPLSEGKRFLYEEEADDINFRTGVPDLSYFPAETWAKLYKQAVVTMASANFDYHHPMGYYPLRQTIVAYLKKWRGVRADPGQILITSGAAQGLSLLKAFVDKDAFVLIENPVSTGIVTTLEQFGVTLKTRPVDEQGFITSDLPEPGPRLILVTPSHQFPTGGVMPVKRRIDLIHYAKGHDAYLVEDDYDSEFRYEGEPLQAMQGLDPSRVIYLGTFSKTLCPAIRLGYMIVPPDLIPIIETAKYNSDIHSPLFEQVALTALMQEGYYEKHLRKMKKVYAHKRQTIIEEFYKHFGNQVIISGHACGLHMVCDFSQVIDRQGLKNAMKAARVNMHFLEDYYAPNTAPKDEVSLVMGFGNVTLKHITCGIEQLSVQIKSIIRNRATKTTVTIE